MQSYYLLKMFFEVDVDVDAFGVDVLVMFEFFLLTSILFENKNQSFLKTIELLPTPLGSSTKLALCN